MGLKPLGDEGVLFEVRDNRLYLEVDLARPGCWSKKGKTINVAGTRGSKQLFDENGMREEVINLTVYRQPRKDESPYGD